MRLVSKGASQKNQNNESGSQVSTGANVSNVSRLSSKEPKDRVMAESATPSTVAECPEMARVRTGAVAAMMASFLALGYLFVVALNGPNDRPDTLTLFIYSLLAMLPLALAYWVQQGSRIASLLLCLVFAAEIGGIIWYGAGLFTLIIPLIFMVIFIRTARAVWHLPLHNASAN